MARCVGPPGDFLEQPAAVIAAPLLARSLAAAPSIAAGTMLGPYRVVREVGRGGAACVYLAEDTRLGRPVAVKVLNLPLAASMGPRRFVREIKLAARLQHPHILPVLDSGDTEGRSWYAMPFVVGESLRQRLARESQLPVDEAVRIARDVALALDYAHRQDIVHRDIKPANILLADGQALVADFGIARALQPEDDATPTETGLVIGTPTYMSPEQCTGDPPVDGRSDIYSLGCVLYEMLAGRPPFAGETAQAGIARRLTERAPRVSVLRAVPSYIEGAIARALERSPGDRFPSAHDFALGLDEAAAVPARPDRRRGRKILGIPVRWLLVAAICLPAGDWAVAGSAGGHSMLSTGP